jgi:membrane protein DedA with SNARE-associated domain
VGEWLEFGVDWVIGLVRGWGYAGIFVMMTIESSFFPFPSEVALIPAGYLASRGEMNPVAATGAGVLGSLVGAFVNYFLALRLGRAFVEWLGRWLPGAEASLATSERFFRSHGEITTFVGRLIPGIRQLISIPAGLARMRLERFALYTGLGAGIWSAILVAVGWIAGESEATWRPLLREASLWLLAAVLTVVLAYLWAHRRSGRLA